MMMRMDITWGLLVFYLVIPLLCRSANDAADCKTSQPFPSPDANCIVAGSVLGKEPNRRKPGSSTYAVAVRGVLGLCDLPSVAPTECWRDGDTVLLVTAATHAAACGSDHLVVGEDYLLSLLFDSYSCPNLAAQDGYSAALRTGIASEAERTSIPRVVRQSIELAREYMY